MNQSRRNWLQSIATVGSGAILLSPKEILAAVPSADHHLPLTNGMVRLSSNENPYSPSPAMKKAISEMGADLCRYPNANFSTLEKMIAEKEGVDPATVVVTSGSREGLKAVGLMKAMKGGEIACCLPTYRALLTYAEYWGSDLRVSPLDENLDYNLPAIEESINENTRMAFVCNPNNPTGTLVDAKALEGFCRRVSKKTTVFVDEVYYDYIEEPGYPSMKHLIAEGHDIIIARTYSKIYGLAGARIGFMMATPETAKKIRDSLMSGTNVLGISLAMAALKDDEFRSFSLEKNKECKELIYEALDDLGLPYLKSHTNFVFFKTDRDIKSVQDDFLAQNVQVGRAFPPYLNWCRISTGKVEEVQAFTAAVRKVFA